LFSDHSAFATRRREAGAATEIGFDHQLSLSVSGKNFELTSPQLDGFSARVFGQVI
jgi:hypothetical protein